MLGATANPDNSMHAQCGLDHAKADAAGHEEQAEVFSQQLHLGMELRRPISVRLSSCDISACTSPCACAMPPVYPCML